MIHLCVYSPSGKQLGSHSSPATDALYSVRSYILPTYPRLSGHTMSSNITPGRPGSVTPTGLYTPVRCHRAPVSAGVPPPPRGSPRGEGTGTTSERPGFHILSGYCITETGEGQSGCIDWLLQGYIFNRDYTCILCNISPK